MRLARHVIALALLSQPGFGLDLAGFEASPLRPAGIDPRKEVEVKLAFNPSLRAESVTQALLERLSVMATKEEFEFARVVGERFKVGSFFRPNVFVDYYLDTPEHFLMRRGAAYRLRYRWDESYKYWLYQWFPFFSDLHPARCEVQFKRDYKFSDREDVLEVTETRFEFRNEAEPFSISKDAPASPWEKTEFIEYAKTGVFRQWHLKPSVELVNFVRAQDPEREKLELGEVLDLIVTRHRLHLTLKHPWGSGPNPDHVILISIDEVQDKGGTSRLLEFEIEMERNTNSMLESILRMPRQGRGKNAIAEAAFEVSEKAEAALRKDLTKIRQVVLDVMQPHAPLPIKNKYARFLSGE